MKFDENMNFHQISSDFTRFHQILFFFSILGKQNEMERNIHIFFVFKNVNPFFKGCFMNLIDVLIFWLQIKS